MLVLCFYPRISLIVSFLVPDPPAGLQAVNITETKALLTWKPSRAKVDHYILSYGSAKCELPSSLVFILTGSVSFIPCLIRYISSFSSATNVAVTVMLSGSSVEHQLRGLHRFTHYTVRLFSQINNLQSRSIFTIFTTMSGKTALIQEVA